MTHSTGGGTSASYGLGLRQSSLAKVGGALGIAATLIAMAVFLVACFNFDAIFMLSPLVVLLAAIGFVLSIVGGVMRPHLGNEETQPVAALFVSLIGLVAGLLESWIAMG